MGFLSDLGTTNALANLQQQVTPAFNNYLAAKEAASKAPLEMALQQRQMIKEEIAMKQHADALKIQQDAEKRAAMDWAELNKPVHLDTYLGGLTKGKAPELMDFYRAKYAPFAEEGPSGLMIRKGKMDEVSKMLAQDKGFALEENVAASTAITRRMNELNDDITKAGDKIRAEIAANPQLRIPETKGYAELAMKKEQRKRLSDRLAAQHEEYLRLKGGDKYVSIPAGGSVLNTLDGTVTEGKGKPATDDRRVVQDPKSPTGWSYQNLSAPGEPLAPNAPPPASATTEEKAPPNRTRHEGDSEIFEEWDKGAKKWVVVSKAPRYRPESPARDQHRTYSDERNMRKDFEALPEVKDYNDIIPKYNNMAAAMEEAKTSKTYVAVDQTIINMYNKMMDPSSVVRESEYARTPQDMAWLSRMQGKIEKIQKGGPGLTDVERQAIFRMATRYRDTAAGLYSARAKEYRGLASDYGFDPNRIITRVTPSKGKQGDKVERRVKADGTILEKGADGVVRVVK